MVIEINTVAPGEGDSSEKVGISWAGDLLEVLESRNVVVDPLILKELRKVVPIVVEKVAKFEHNLKKKYKTQYKDAYEELQLKRRKSGKKPPPSLETIINNFVCMSPTRRVQEASTLIQKEFSEDKVLLPIFEDSALLKTFQELILDLHTTHENKHLKPFELAKYPHIMNEGMMKTRAFFDTHGVSNAISDSIYERLADYGYLGTIEEIRDIQEKISKIRDISYLDGSDGTLFGLVGGLAGLVQAFLISMGMYGTPPEAMEHIPMVSMLLFISALMWFILFGILIGEGKTTINTFALPFNKAKQSILQHKLSKLQERDKKIKHIVSLYTKLTGYDDSYEDRDSMSDKQIDKVYQDLTNIDILSTKLDRKYTYEQLNLLSSRELQEYAQKIKSYDKELIEKRIASMLELLDGVSPDKMEQIKKQVYNTVMEQYDLQSLGYLDTASVQDFARIIHTLDEVMKKDTWSEEQKEAYNRLKDTVQASRKEEDLHALQQLVKGYIQDFFHSSYEMKKEVLEKYLEDLGITDENHPQLFYDIFDLLLEKHFTEPPLSQLPVGNDDVLDLSELEKVIKQKMLRE